MKKQAFMVKLDAETATWVERQAAVFGSRSLVIRVALRVLIALISLGTLKWELPELQALLLGNHRNRRNQVPAGRSGQSPLLTDSRLPQGISTTHLRRSDAVLGREETATWRTSFLGIHTYPQVLIRSVRS